MVERSVTASELLGKMVLDEIFEYVSATENKRSSSLEEETIKWSHNLLNKKKA